MKQALAVAATVFLLAACSPDQGPKQTLGTIIGGVGGAVLGNEVGKGRGRKVAIAAGTLLGAMLGSRLGRDLDEADRITAEQTTQGALERGRTGDRSEWENPGQRQFGLGRADAHLAGGFGPVLPRVPDGHHRWRRGADRLRHGLPPAGRQLEDRPARGLMRDPYAALGCPRGR